MKKLLYCAALVATVSLYSLQPTTPTPTTDDPTQPSTNSTLLLPGGAPPPTGNLK